jgi:hypothetical protein
MANRTFKFDVSETDQFTYTPADDWKYSKQDILRFETQAGPFTIDFKPRDAALPPNFNPLSGPLDSVEDRSGVWFAETTVKDDLSPEARKSLMDSNKSKEFPNGFLARYTYDINVTKNGKKLHNATHNGVYSC